MADEEREAEIRRIYSEDVGGNPEDLTFRLDYTGETRFAVQWKGIGHIAFIPRQWVDEHRTIEIKRRLELITPG